MTRFGECVEIVLKQEGVYSNDSRDPGGETRYGISKRAYPDLGIATLTLEQARVIYYRDYWQRIKGDSLPPALALLVFDMAVNAGVSAASRLLQAQVGVTVDGGIGPETLAAVDAHYSGRDLRYYTSRRIQYYTRLSGWKAFGDGWTLRSLSVYQQALGMHLRSNLDTDLERL